MRLKNMIAASLMMAATLTSACDPYEGSNAKVYQYLPRSGDTLWGIAEKEGIPANQREDYVTQIQRMNEGLFYQGQPRVGPNGELRKGVWIDAFDLDRDGQIGGQPVKDMKYEYEL